MTDLCSLCVSRITSLFALYFVFCHAGNFSSFSHSWSTSAFKSGIFIAWTIGTNLCTIRPSLQGDLRDLLMESLPNAFSRRSLDERFVVFSLQGIAVLHWMFKCFLAFLMVSSNSFSSGSIKVDASQLSRIVELQFLDSPLLPFLCFRHTGPNFWPQMIRPCGCLNLCKPPSGPHISVGRFFIEYWLTA